MQIIDSNKKLKSFFINEANNLRTKGIINPRTSEYFGQIGSIPIEDIKYEDQLSIKLKALKIIFNDTFSSDFLDNLQIEASPEVNEYRFRMDFVCSHDPFHEPFDRFGQRKAKQFNFVIDMQSCNLVGKEWFEKTRKIYDYIFASGVENYDLVSKKGDLRYLVLRCYKDQAMLNIVTKTKDHKDEIANSAKLANDLGFQSINWIHQPLDSDLSEGEVLESFYQDFIEVKLNEDIFKVGPNNFFQNNILGFEKIIEFVKDNLSKDLRPTSNVIPTNAAGRRQTLYDFYSGVGTLGITFAKYFEQVKCYEVIDENVKIASSNAEINGVNNIEFNLSDLSKDSNLRFKDDSESTIILDPPRTGLEGNMFEFINQINPQQIIYISCNPITQARDLKILVQKNYEIVDAKGFDLFPHTYHMENVVILSKIN